MAETLEPTHSLKHTHRHTHTLVSLCASASPAYATDQVDLSTKGWLIGIMCAVAIIVLFLLIVCFIKRSRGGKYPGTVGRALDVWYLQS